MRRYSGTQQGEHYRQLLNFGTEQNVTDPKNHERTLGDLLDPLRPGRMTDLVNSVTRETGIDAATWRVDRLLRMVASIEYAAAQQQTTQ